MPTLGAITIGVHSHFDQTQHPEFPYPGVPEKYNAPVTRRSKGRQSITALGERFMNHSKLRAPKSDDSTASVYIPSMPAARFFIKYTIKPPFESGVYFYFKLSMNGSHIASWGINPRLKPRGQVTRALFDAGTRDYEQDGKTFSGTGTESRTLMFAPESKNASPAQDGGLIEVKVFRSGGKIRKHAEAEAFRPQEQFGLMFPSSGLVASPGEDARYYDWILIDPRDKPYATFRFHYRSWDDLQSLSMIAAKQPRKLLPLSPSFGTLAMYMAKTYQPDSSMSGINEEPDTAINELTQNEIIDNTKRKLVGILKTTNRQRPYDCSRDGTPPKSAGHSTNVMDDGSPSRHGNDIARLIAPKDISIGTRSLRTDVYDQLKHEDDGNMYSDSEIESLEEKCSSSDATCIPSSSDLLCEARRPLPKPPPTDHRCSQSLDASVNFSCEKTNHNWIVSAASVIKAQQCSDSSSSAARMDTPRNSRASSALSAMSNGSWISPSLKVWADEGCQSGACSPEPEVGEAVGISLVGIGPSIASASESPFEDSASPYVIASETVPASGTADSYQPRSRTSSRTCRGVEPKARFWTSDISSVITAKHDWYEDDELFDIGTYDDDPSPLLLEMEEDESYQGEATDQTPRYRHSTRSSKDFQETFDVTHHGPTLAEYAESIEEPIMDLRGIEAAKSCLTLSSFESSMSSEPPINRVLTRSPRFGRQLLSAPRAPGIPRIATNHDSLSQLENWEASAEVCDSPPRQHYSSFFESMGEHHAQAAPTTDEPSLSERYPAEWGAAHARVNEIDKRMSDLNLIPPSAWPVSDVVGNQMEYTLPPDQQSRRGWF